MIPAGAHTTLDFASPGPGVRVSGNIDRIELGFADPVFDPVIGLIAPDGAALEGRIEFIDDRTLRFDIARLSEPGEYVVTYKVTAPDDDDQPNLEGAYAFTYLGGATASRSNWLYFAGVVALLGAVGGLLVRRARRELPPEKSADSG